MTITIIATPASSTANSYVELTEANTYFEAHLKADVWLALDDEKKKASLVASTRMIETEQFGGKRSTQPQSLAWPRVYVYDYDGYTVNGIPSKLKSATLELAMWNLQEDERLAGRFEIETMDSVEIGPIKYKIAADAEYIPDFIEDMLEAIGPNAVLDSSTSLTTMVL